MMKNTYKYILIAACSIASVISCVRFEEQDIPDVAEKVHMTFTATIEGESNPETKTVLGGKMGEEYRKVLWQPGDSIGVINTLGYKEMDKFINISHDTDTLATFSGSTNEGNPYYMFYPYNSSLYATDWDKIYFTLPSEQTYSKESFGSNAMPMVAKGNPEETLQFYSLCGVLALNLIGSETIQSISFTGKDADGNPLPVAGDYYIYMNYEDVPGEIYTRNTNNISTVTLGCGDGVALDPVDSTAFYIVLPPATYESFNIIIATTDGKIMLKESSKPLTIKRCNATKTSALTYVANETIYLSELGTANSYIVNESGLYSIDATIIGNGEFGIIDRAGFHTNSTSIAPTGAKLLWEDKPGIIGGVTHPTDGKISFLATDTEGNALIAATDADGNILWSWHIWVTDQPAEQVYVNSTGTYTMLDRNIGATSAERGASDDEWMQSWGLNFQWGRKDPFAMDKYTRYDSKMTIAQTVQNPSSFAAAGYDKWSEEWSDSMWSTEQKTIYDPCPIGYRVPVMDVWAGFSTTGDSVNKTEEMNVSGVFDKGWSFKINDSETAWYPATSYVNYWSNFGYNETTGHYWSTAYNRDQFSYVLYFSYNSDLDCYLQLNESYTTVSSAYPVRCMKDDQVGGVSVRMRDVPSITPTSAQVVAYVAVMGEYEIERSGFVYGTEPTVDLGNGTEVSDLENKVGEISAEITGLAPYTKYYVKAFAVTTGGDIHYSPSAMSFVTPTEDGKVNLSVNATANSYMLPPMAMDCSFNATVIGNGEFGIVEGAGFHTSNTTIAPVSAELLWSDREGLIVKDSVAFDGTNISFKTTGLEGNAMIAAKDENDKILWSWHIWITDIPDDQLYQNDLGVFTVQDRNLGATRADRGLGDQWHESTGLDFQWGRKDPFAGGFLQETNQDYNISDFILHPTVMPNNWERGEHFWKPDQKTIYDPCPTGYRVASTDIWNNLTPTGSFNNGWYFIYNEAGDVTWYPNRAKAYADYVNYWGDGYLLSSNYEDGFYYYHENVYVTGFTSGNLRCMKDEDATSVTVKVKSVSEVTSTSAVAEASVAAQGNIAVERAGIIYGTSSAPTMESGTVIDTEVTSGKFTSTIEGLASLTKYYVRAFAVADNGTIYYSDKTMSFITPGEDGIVNLSVGGTANCYIVYPVKGTYIFDLVKGNSKESVGAVETVDVLWETYNNSNDVLLGSIVDTAMVDNGKARFEIAENAPSGNALLAAKNAEGTVLWSWHIWVADYDPDMTQQTYASGAIMMDRNLGATSVVPGTVESYGFFYQWGRKDPFVIPGYMTTAPADAITYATYDSNNDTIEHAYQNPTVVYDDSQWNSVTELWVPGTVKTVHDPCPVGWKVSDIAAWKDVTRAENSQYGYYQLSSASAAPIAYIPLAGYTDGDATVVQYSERGHIWLAERRSIMNFWVWNSSPSQNNSYAVDGLRSVRCMKVDDGEKPGSGNDYVVDDEYEWE